MSEMTYTGRVVVGYDGSADSQVGLEWAVAEATRSGAPLRVVVVSAAATLGAGEVWFAPRDDTPVIREQAEKTIAGAHVADAEVEVLDGPVARELRDYATSHDLLVVGSRGHGKLTGAFIGSVSGYLIGHAPCPVVVARPVADPTATQVTVGVDGSDQSLLALGWAVRRAQREVGDVVALYGFRAGEPGGPFGSTMGDEFSQHLDRADRQLRAWVDHAPVIEATAIRAEAIALAPSRLLVDVSKRSALVVVGAHGHAVSGMLVGSVTDRVVARAHCPVVVVR